MQNVVLGALAYSITGSPTFVGILGLAQSGVSRHLGLLKDAGLVIDRRAGNRRIYQADPDGVAALRDQLDRFWNQALATFKEVVEQDTQEVS